MDPNIMKLLEEDEDESMHSGADVEAFQAALNRDIGGYDPEPPQSDSASGLSHESNQNSSQLFPNWQSTGHNENASVPNQHVQQSVLHQQQQQQEQKPSVVGIDQKRSLTENQQNRNVGSLSQGDFQQGRIGKIQHMTPQTSRTHMSEKSPISSSEHGNVQYPKTTPPLSNPQKMGNQPANMDSNAKNQGKQIPFIQLLPYLRPHLDKDRDLQLHGLFTKLRSNAIAKESFVRLMRNIVGDQVIKLAVAQLQSQQNSNASPQSQPQAVSRQHPVRMPAPGSATQATDAQMFGRGSVGSTGPSHSSSAVQYASAEANSQKIQGHDSHGMSLAQKSSSSASITKQESERPSTTMPGHNNQQSHLPPTSLPLYGSSTGGYYKNFGASPAPFPSVNYVKQEAVEQTVEPGNPCSDTQSSEVGFAAPTGMLTPNSNSSVTTQLEHGSQVGTRVPSTASPAGVIGRTPQKRPSSGQKKQPENFGSSPSKKMKASGAFSDQSIEHLNDVTAVSGVNLREEEEQLFSGPKESSRISEVSRKVVQEEEERLIVHKHPLHKKLVEIMAKFGLKNIGNDVDRCLSLCVEERMRGIISNLIRLSKQRVDMEKSRHRTVITSDVQQQILQMNQKAREEWEKKQAEVEKLRKFNDPEIDNEAEGDKEKEESRARSVKATRDDDEKLRATAANVAARAAVGGDDMLSKWQLMAEQARQKREGGTDPVGTKEVNCSKPASTPGKKGNQNSEKRSPTSLTATSAENTKKSGRNQSNVSPTRVTRSITVKDVIALLEREPQMSKSTLIYRLYERIRSDATAD